MQVLLVEDDVNCRDELTRALHREGIRAVTVGRGRAALDHFSEVDVVLLKLQLPDINGFELCQIIRLSSQVPIIMVSGHDDEFDCVLGLKVGADDYVVRPYRLHELLARMQAVVRRATGQWPANLMDSVRNIGVLHLDLHLRQAVVRGAEIALTRKEFDLLAFLASEPGRTFTREGIMSEVWGHDGSGDTRTLGVHIAGLRRKLSVGNLIETVWGVGFRLTEAQHHRQDVIDLARNIARLPRPGLPLEVQFQRTLMAVGDQVGTHGDAQSRFCLLVHRAQLEAASARGLGCSSLEVRASQTKLWRLVIPPALRPLVGILRLFA